MLEGAKLAPWIVAGATAAPLIVIGGVGIVGLGLIGGILYISPWEPTYPENFPPTRVATPTYTSPFPQTNATPAPPNYQPITQQQEVIPPPQPVPMPPTTTSNNEPEINAPGVPQTLTDPCPTSSAPEAPPKTRPKDRPDGYEFVGYHGTSSSSVLSILTAIYAQGRGQLGTGFYVYQVEPKPVPQMTNSNETAFFQAKEAGRAAAAARGGESSVVCIFARNYSTMSWRYVPAENPEQEGGYFWWHIPHSFTINYDYLVSEVDGDPDIWQIKFNQKAVGELLAADCNE